MISKNKEMLNLIKIKVNTFTKDVIEDTHKIKEELISLLNQYIIILLVFNLIVLSGFCLLSYRFFYQETQTDIEIIKKIIKENQKYWWDKENNILYRDSINPNLKDKK